MAANNEYKRFFIILQEDEKGFELSLGKIPTGYIKIEIKNGKAKLTAYVQNVRADEKLEYRMVLAAPAKNKAVDIGRILVDNSGRGEFYYEFESDNVLKMDIPASEFTAAAVSCGKAFPLTGSAGREKPDWRGKVEIVERSDKNKMPAEPYLTEEPIPAKGNVAPIMEEEPIPAKGKVVPIVEEVAEEEVPVPPPPPPPPPPVPVPAPEVPVEKPKPVVGLFGELEFKWESEKKPVEIPVEIKPEEIKSEVCEPIPIVEEAPVCEPVPIVEEAPICEHAEPVVEKEVECEPLEEIEPEVITVPHIEYQEKHHCPIPCQKSSCSYLERINRHIWEMTRRLERCEPFGHPKEHHHMKGCKWYCIGRHMEHLHDIMIPMEGYAVPMDYPYSLGTYLDMPDDEYILGIQYDEDHDDEKEIRYLLFGMPGIYDKRMAKYFKQNGYAYFVPGKYRDEGYWLMRLEFRSGQIDYGGLGLNNF